MISELECSLYFGWGKIHSCHPFSSFRLITELLVFVGNFFIRTWSQVICCKISFVFTYVCCVRSGESVVVMINELFTGITEHMNCYSLRTLQYLQRCELASDLSKNTFKTIFMYLMLNVMFFYCFWKVHCFWKSVVHVSYIYKIANQKLKLPGLIRPPHYFNIVDNKY